MVQLTVISSLSLTNWLAHGVSVLALHTRHASKLVQIWCGCFSSGQSMCDVDASAASAALHGLIHTIRTVLCTDQQTDTHAGTPRMYTPVLSVPGAPDRADLISAYCAAWNVQGGCRCWQQLYKVGKSEKHDGDSSSSVPLDHSEGRLPICIA